MSGDELLERPITFHWEERDGVRTPKLSAEDAERMRRLLLEQAEADEHTPKLRPGDTEAIGRIPLPTEGIPEQAWEHCGFAGHFVGGADCRFHLNTRVGSVRITTVGDYHPKGQARAKSLSPLVAGRGGLYETEAFELEGEGDRAEHGVHGRVRTWEALTRRFAATPEEAEANHVELCRMYARKGGIP